MVRTDWKTEQDEALSPFPLSEKSLDGVKIRAIIRTVSRIIFDPAALSPPARATAAFALPLEMQR
jgi:hypothetical protein